MSASIPPVRRAESPSQIAASCSVSSVSDRAPSGVIERHQPREPRGSQRCQSDPFKPRAPPFSEWFHGRFWNEWVIGRKNKPGERGEKQTIYRAHLGPRFGTLPLDEITTSEVARFRANLVASGLGEKRINNILAVLSKALRYAVDCDLLAKAPKIGMFKVERSEIVAWDFAQYARLLAAAKNDSEEWYAAVCLAGEAGLRVGETKALRWREDVDLVARTITVSGSSAPCGASDPSACPWCPWTCSTTR